MSLICIINNVWLYETWMAGRAEHKTKPMPILWPFWDKVCLFIPYAKLPSHIWYPFVFVSARQQSAVLSVHNCVTYTSANKQLFTHLQPYVTLFLVQMMKLLANVTQDPYESHMAAFIYTMSNIIDKYVKPPSRNILFTMYGYQENINKAPNENKKFLIPFEPNIFWYHFNQRESLATNPHMHACSVFFLQLKCYTLKCQGVFSPKLQKFIPRKSYFSSHINYIFQLM